MNIDQICEGVLTKMSSLLGLDQETLKTMRKNTISPELDMNSDYWKRLVMDYNNKTLTRWTNKELDKSLDMFRQFDHLIPVKSRCRVKSQKIKLLEEAIVRVELSRGEEDTGTLI